MVQQQIGASIFDIKLPARAAALISFACTGGCTPRSMSSPAATTAENPTGG